MTPAEFCSGMLAMVRQDEPMPNRRLASFLALLNDVAERNPSVEQFESELQAPWQGDPEAAIVPTWLLDAWRETRDGHSSTGNRSAG
jgi:hypothetical protein